MAENPRDKVDDGFVDDSAVAAVKLQDFVRDLRLQLEREKCERKVLSERVQSVICDKDQLESQYEEVRKNYCCLKEKNAILEAKVKANEWELQQSENRWKECDIKLKKMLTNVNAKEECLLNQFSRRQQPEIGNQSLLNELCVVKETLSVLHNECKQLQKEFLGQSAPRLPSWASNEMRSKELGAVRKQLDEANYLCQQVMGENQNLLSQFNSQKMEACEWKKQIEKLQCTLDLEREEMQREVCKAREGQKIEEDALKESTLGYMVQVNNLQCENNNLRRRLEESAQRIAALESDVACHVGSVQSYREELFMLRRQFDESQRNFNSNQEEQTNARKRLEIDLELVCKENGELKENIRNTTSNVKLKNCDLLSPRLSRRANCEMEQLRNQVSILHDEMSFMKRQLRTTAPSDPFDHRHIHNPVANTSSGPFSPVRPQTPPNKLAPWCPADPTKSKLCDGSKLISEDEQQSNGREPDDCADISTQTASDIKNNKNRAHFKG